MAEFSQLPPELKQQITDLVTDFRGRQSLLRVSKQFHTHAKRAPFVYDSVMLMLGVDKVTVRVIKKEADWRKKKYLLIHFYPHRSGVLKTNPCSYWKQIIPKQDYREAAVHFFLDFLNHKDSKTVEFLLRVEPWLTNDPSYPIKKFLIDRKIVLDEIQRILCNLRFKLQVEKLNVKFQVSDDQLLQILPYLTPGTLENIDLIYKYPIQNDLRNYPKLELFVDTLQWKMAKQAITSCYEINVPFEKIEHFEVLEFTWRTNTIPMAEIHQTFLSHKSWKQLVLHSTTQADLTGLERYLAQFNPTRDPDIPSVRILENVFLEEEKRLTLEIKGETVVMCRIPMELVDLEEESEEAEEISDEEELSTRSSKRRKRMRKLAIGLVIVLVSLLIMLFFIYRNFCLQ